MEKLRCSSCGGEMTIDENKEYATCNYCGTKYKLNKDVNVNIKLDENTKEVLSDGFGRINKFSWIIFIPIIIFFVIFVIMLVNMNSFNIGISNSHDNYEEEKEIDDSFEKSSFNVQFFGANGTKSDFFLGYILDDIIQSNKTNDRKVVLVFDGKEISDENEIIDIKHSLSGNYEVSLNYDDAGYINKIVVDKID